MRVSVWNKLASHPEGVEFSLIVASATGTGTSKSQPSDFFETRRLE